MRAVTNTSITSKGMPFGDDYPCQDRHSIPFTPAFRISAFSESPGADHYTFALSQQPGIGPPFRALFVRQILRFQVGDCHIIKYKQARKKHKTPEFPSAAEISDKLYC